MPESNVINLDIPSEEIKETPLIPDGTIAVVQVKRVVIKESEKYSTSKSKALNLQLGIDIIDAPEDDYLGVPLFENVTVPSKAWDDTLGKEYPSMKQAWRNTFATVLRVCNVPVAAEFNADTLIGAKIKIQTKQQTRKDTGDTTNGIGKYLESVG